MGISTEESPEARSGSPSGSSDGLWLALVLDGEGGARVLDWDGVRAWSPDDGRLWVHLDPGHAQAIAWLEEVRGISESDRQALLQPSPRPRLEALGDERFIITLRGLAPELDEQGLDLDLATLHLWLEPTRVVSLCDRALPGVGRAQAHYRQGDGPKDLAELLVWLAEGLGASLYEAAISLEDPMAELEYVADGEHQAPTGHVGKLERRVLRLRQHLAPVKVLQARLLTMPAAWIVAAQVARWSQLADQARNTDDLLQALQTRAGALRGSIQERLARRTNRVLYILTVLSAVTLPLTLLTGLLGMNVGIHGASYPRMGSGYSLLLVCVVLVVIAALEYLVIRRRNLL